MKQLAATLLRVGLGATFLYAAFTKIPDLPTFAEEIANYQMLPAQLVPLVAAALPGLEIALGLALIAGIWTRTAAALTGGLLLVFTVGISQALIRGIDLRCGCFGTAETASWETVIRDVVLVAIAGAVTWLGPGRFALEGRAQGRPEQTASA